MLFDSFCKNGRNLLCLWRKRATHSSLVRNAKGNNSDTFKKDIIVAIIFTKTIYFSYTCTLVLYYSANMLTPALLFRRSNNKEEVTCVTNIIKLIPAPMPQMMKALCISRIVRVRGPDLLRAGLQCVTEGQYFFLQNSVNPLSFICCILLCAIQ